MYTHVKKVLCTTMAAFVVINSVLQPVIATGNLFASSTAVAADLQQEVSGGEQLQITANAIAQDQLVPHTLLPTSDEVATTEAQQAAQTVAGD
jgi:hypothetical protein